jgi:antirestriction protein ArdC
MPKRSHKRKPPTETERAERRERERRLMAEAIERLRSSEGWQRWLKVRRHFHCYSLHNQFLIAMQMPDASRVAGFKAWMKLGYVVQKGETGIYIWAPCPPSKRRIAEWREAGADPDERPRTFFRLVKVFDRSQVRALPDFPGGPVDLEPPSEPVTGDGLAHLFGALVTFGERIGSPIRVEATAGPARGELSLRDGRIRVDPVDEDFSPNAQVAVAFHELSHALVRSDRREDDPILSYAEEEVVVECVAYVVCSAAGLDTTGSSVPYVTGWGKGEEVERYAALIDRLAQRLEDAILESPGPEAAEAKVLAAAA